MRVLAVVLVATITPVAPAFAHPTASSYPKAGITVTIPSGWRVVDRRLTPCTNPIERVTIAGNGALVTLMETLDPRRYVARFDPRPRRFALRGTPQPIACCAPSERDGWFFNFRDRGRGFYVYVYLGAPETRAQALAVLDTLQVAPR